MNATDQPNTTVRKAGGASLGATLAIVIGWVCASYGHAMPQEVAVAVGSLVGSTASELAALVDRYLNRHIATLPARQVTTTKAFIPDTDPAAPAATNGDHDGQ